MSRDCFHCKATKADEDLRPYGPGGADVCFPCAMKPENAATTLVTGLNKLAAAGPTAVFTTNGPKSIADVGPDDVVTFTPGSRVST